MKPMDESSWTALLRIPVPVRFGDTDPYGVIYFASYFRYCHHGIEELMRHLGLPPHEHFRNVREGYGLPIVGAACDFLRPVRYGDELSLEVCVARLGERSLTLGFRFFHDEALAGRGQATMVCIDESWRARPLPQGLRRAIEVAVPEESP